MTLSSACTPGKTKRNKVTNFSKACNNWFVEMEELKNQIDAERAEKEGKDMQFRPQINHKSSTSLASNQS